MICITVFSILYFSVQQGPAGATGPKGARGGSGPPVSNPSQLHYSKGKCMEN